MKKAILILFFLADLTAQNPKLTIPPNYLNVIGGSTPALPISLSGYQGNVTPTAFCHNSMIDYNGNLKFFVSDNAVYDAAGDPIGTGYLYGNTGDATGSQEVCIVPDPGNCTRYYIFSSASFDFQNWFPTYSIVDLATNEIVPFGANTA